MLFWIQSWWIDDVVQWTGGGDLNGLHFSCDKKPTGARTKALSAGGHFFVPGGFPLVRRHACSVLFLFLTETTAAAHKKAAERESRSQESSSSSFFLPLFFPPLFCLNPPNFRSGGGFRSMEQPGFFMSRSYRFHGFMLSKFGKTKKVVDR